MEEFNIVKGQKDELIRKLSEQLTTFGEENKELKSKI